LFFDNDRDRTRLPKHEANRLVGFRPCPIGNPLPEGIDDGQRVRIKLRTKAVGCQKRGLCRVGVEQVQGFARRRAIIDAEDGEIAVFGKGFEIGLAVEDQRGVGGVAGIRLFGGVGLVLRIDGQVGIRGAASEGERKGEKGKQGGESHRIS